MTQQPFASRQAPVFKPAQSPGRIRPVVGLRFILPALSSPPASVFLAVFLFFLASCSTGGKLVSKGQSDYRIHVSAQASAPEQYAARELQKYLEEMSGCRLEITHEPAQGPAGEPPANGKGIYIGFRNAPASLLEGLDTAGFGKEEYIIRSDGKDMLIAGGAPRGTLYGVIGYLSDHLGCRWYTREVTKVPTRTSIELSPVEDRQQPAFEYREPYYREAQNPEWAVHNRTNPSIAPIPDSLGGSYITYPFVHTFYQLVPPEKYFRAHPEYFAEVGGVRKGEEAQLCLTNPGVVKVATATVFGWISEHPEANVFSVDQNDGYGYCECRNCKALDEAEGSHSGTLLHFVNQIADTVAKVYPDIKLQTLAYAYTEVPPKTLRPAPNVTIRLCHYNYCSAHALGTCPDHEPFIERLEGWRDIADRITVWDYFTDFDRYLMPYPNFETVKYNPKFYADRNVIGLFAQGNNVPENGGGEFTELRAWVFSQLMWDPDRDGQRLIEEFIRNVYGDAGSYIREYVGLMQASVRPDSVYFNIWSEPGECSYLTPEFTRRADSLFTLALEAAQSDPALLARVERAYLPVLYTQLYFYGLGGRAYLSKERFPEALDAFKRIVADNRIAQMAEVRDRGDIAKFIALAESADITFITDWWIVGPFNYSGDHSGGQGLKAVFPPERQSFDRQASYSGGKGETLTWKHYEDPAYGYVDFTKLFPPAENAVAYAYREMEFDTDGSVKFGVGSNDGVKVWVNGKTVLDRPVSRRAEPNQDTVTVRVKKGRNTVLVKVDQIARGWGFYFAELE